MTQPQLSPDGQWWWNGTSWRPATEAPPSAAPVPDPFAPAPVDPTPPTAYGSPAAGYGAPQYGSPPPGYGGYPPAQPSSTDGLAVTSLITSLVWLGGIGSIAAVITGHLSRSKAKREGRSPSGLALAGLIIGYLGIAGMVLLIVAIFALGGTVGKAITTDVHARSDLRNAATAEEVYFTDHSSYTDEAGLRTTGFTPHSDVGFSVVSFSETRYCLRAQASFDTVYYYDSTDISRGVSETPCS